MSVLKEGTLASKPWLVASGNRHEVFAALGSWASEHIHDAATTLVHGSELGAYAASEGGRSQVEAIRELTMHTCPAEYNELLALARGAEVHEDELFVLNLRGDLGQPTGTGCSDLAWTGESPLIAHNEDGLPFFEDRWVFVTLAIEHEHPVFAFWYPGMLPSNAFVATGSGQIWSLDHLSVARPPAAIGRHFAARRGQRSASLPAALEALSSAPSAGGFAYTIGLVPEGSVAVLEAGGGRISQDHSLARDRERLWHANGIRYLDAVPASPDDESQQRSERMQQWARVAERPTVKSLLQQLGQATDWPAFYRSAVSPDPLMTLCTMVCELSEGIITLSPRNAAPVALQISELTQPM